MTVRHAALAQFSEALSAKRPLKVEGDYREAAVLVALKENATDPELILTRRAQHMRLHPGEAAFPGGKQDPEDKNLLATALREANEEVGLLREHFQLLGQLDQRVSRSDLKVSAFVGLVPGDVPLLINSEELDCIYSVPVSHFCQLDNMALQTTTYQGQVYHVPQFTYREHTITGMTAMMIVDLLNTGFAADIRVPALA